MSETKVLHEWTSGEKRLRIVGVVGSASWPILEAWSDHRPEWSEIDPVARVVANEITRLARELEEARRQNAILNSEIIRVEGGLAAVLSPNAEKE